MTAAAEAPVESGALLRVTLVAGERRGDLALPGQVPVVELVPELARSTNLLDPETVYAGYHLVAADGRRLEGDLGLQAQGIENGAVLTLVAGVSDRPPRVYDDVVEAMADVVEEDMRPWKAADGRRTALVSAALVLLLGALSLGLQRPDVVAGAAAGVVAVVLVVSAIVLDRVRQEHETAVLLAWSGVVFAATAGLTGAPEGPMLQIPVAIAAAAAFAAGLLAVLGLTERRMWLVPATAFGALAGIGAAITSTTDLRPASVFLVLLVVVTVAGSLVPWLSLATTPTQVPQAHDHAQLLPDTVDPVDEHAVRRDARIGHAVLMTVTTTVALVVVAVAPLAVSLGLTGTVVAVAASVVLLLRTRQYRVGPEVVVGLAAGVAGLLAVCVSVVVLQPSWLSGLAVVLAVVAVALLLSTLVPRPQSVRLGRLGDVAEVVALVAMLPLTVLAIGLVSAVS